MKLSAELSAIVGEEEASRAQCVKLLWAYLKEKNLQDPENKQFFTPDKKMAKVFGNERMRCFSMSKFLTPHLSAIELGDRPCLGLRPSQTNLWLNLVTNSILCAK